MSMYLIYEKTTGTIYRELDQYHIEEDGTVVGGINGANTLRYLPGTNPAVIEVSEDVIVGIADNYGKYKVVDGVIVENSDYTEDVDLATTILNLEVAQAEQEEINIAQDDALIELYEMIGG